MDFDDKDDDDDREDNEDKGATTTTTTTTTTNATTSHRRDDGRQWIPPVRPSCTSSILNAASRLANLRMLRCNDEFPALLVSTMSRSTGLARPCHGEGQHTEMQPPVTSAPVPSGVNPLHMAIEWGRKRGLRIASLGHAVVCSQTGTVLLVDVVFAKCRKARHPAHPRVHRTANSECFLAHVYYSESRGGLASHHARRYMMQVKSVCNRDMQFFPKVLSICVYGGANAKIYAREVDAIM